MSAALLAGLNDPVFDSQEIFRAVLDAMAQPGKIITVGKATEAPPPLMPAAAGIALSLFDLSTPIWLSAQTDNDAVRAYLAFHTRCPITPRPADAAFAILNGTEMPKNFDDFAPGTPEYPDSSTTLIMQVDDLRAGSGCCLRGPGIEKENHLKAHGITPDFWPAVAGNAGNFPLGIDLILTAGDRLTALPRTIKVEY